MRGLFVITCLRFLEYAKKSYNIEIIGASNMTEATKIYQEINPKGI